MTRDGRMRAIVITKFGGPEVLAETRLPEPVATPERVVVRVQAFGLNHAEVYFRRGIWGDVAKVSGIECVGQVHDPGGSGLVRGQRVFALMGGLGRTLDGSYAEYAAVPNAHVIPIDSDLDWTELAAIPESYATAWAFLRHNLELRPGQTVVVRGGTSALGQAAIQLARAMEARVIASTRATDKLHLIEQLGAEPVLEQAELSTEIRRRVPVGVDAVLDIIGSSTLLDSFKMVRYRGRVALAGFLGGMAKLSLDPLLHLPSGLQFSFFASAFMFGTPEFALTQVPFQHFADCAATGIYRARPAHVFDFEQIVDAHRLLESGQARGKIVVRGARAEPA